MPEPRKPVHTDYAISKEDAKELLGVELLPVEFRLLALKKYRRRYGSDALLRFFAEFIGLANSVVANNREFIELYAITELGQHPHGISV